MGLPTTRPGITIDYLIYVTDKNGVTTPYKPLDLPTEITPASADDDQFAKDLSANTSYLVWDSLTSPVASFNFLLMLVIGGTAEVEITASQAADPQLFVVTLHPDAPPFVLAADESRKIAVAGDLLVGTATVINKIRCRTANAGVTLYGRFMR